MTKPQKIEEGWVERLKSVAPFTYQRIEEFVSTEIEKAKASERQRCVEVSETLYDKLQETKYYKELSYIEKQVYLSAVDHVTQALQAKHNLEQMK